MEVVEGEARALSIERDAAVTERAGTRTCLELANEHCIRFQKEIVALKEDQERLEDAKRKLKSSGEQFDRLRADYHFEKGKVDKLQAELQELKQEQQLKERPPVQVKIKTDHRETHVVSTGMCPLWYGSEAHRFRLECEHKEYAAALKLPTFDERNAAVAKCTNSGVMPGATFEEVAASNAKTANIMAAQFEVDKARIAAEKAKANGSTVFYDEVDDLTPAERNELRRMELNGGKQEVSQRFRPFPREELASEMRKDCEEVD